jgi:hypothetical protein
MCGSRTDRLHAASVHVPAIAANARILLGSGAGTGVALGAGMTRSKALSLSLASLLPLGLFACSSPSVSTKGQLIECTTDATTGVVLSCQPGTGSGGANTCIDVDEDGDGEPADGADDDASGAASLVGRPDDGGGDAADDDGDGIPDDEDCDHQPGEDHDGDGGEVDLPYDIRLSLGQTTTPIHDAFAAGGAQPAAIVSVTGATWRITELQAGTAFVVTDADCSHVGTSDIGRDRVVVTWQNADGSTHADHLDLRYCQ